MFRTMKLNNGVSVLLAHYDGIETLSIGISYNVGGRNEWKLPPEYDGVSHFLEHVFFKGNGKYSSSQVNEILDDLGGMNNAFTTDDVTCYYAHVPVEAADAAIDLFHNLLNFRNIDGNEFEKESFVVRQEMRRMEDTPHFLLFVKLKEAINAGSSLEMTVIGNEYSLSTIKLEQMEEYREKYYDLSNAVIMIIGNFDESSILDKLNSSFGSFPISESKPSYESTQFIPPTSSSLSSIFIQKPLPLLYFGLGMLTVGAKSKYAESLEILSVYLSSGRSSVLEEDLVRPGIASFAWAELDLWEDIGNLIIVVGAEQENFDEARELSFKALYKLKTTNFDEELLTKLCDKMERKLRMGLENPQNLLFQQSTTYWRRGKFESIEEQIEFYRSVTPEMIVEAQEYIFTNVRIVFGLVGEDDLSTGKFPKGTWD